MKALSPLDSIAFAELLDLCNTESVTSAYKANGNFVKQRRNMDGEYWYYRGYEKPIDGSPGKPTLKYVGRVGDPDTEATVAIHGNLRRTYKKRHELASHLRRAGLPTPQPMEGAITSALADLGVFTGGSIMVGSVAFQTFGGILGVKIQEGTYRTQDIDVAQPAGLRIEPKIPPTDIFEALKKADASFEPIFLGDEPRLVAGFINKDKFKVEFLTPQRSDRKSTSRMTEVAGLPGIGAARLKYLEFVLTDPTNSVMLHDAGVRVGVPDPMRYAVHKLIVSVERSSPNSPDRSSIKAVKDVLQAEALIEASEHSRTGGHLGAIWVEAWNNGPTWRKTLRDGTLKLSADKLTRLANHAAEAAVMEGKACPFIGGADPRRELIEAWPLQRERRR